jgi:TetR/AcrR family transcriptional regulator
MYQVVVFEQYLTKWLNTINLLRFVWMNTKDKIISAAKEVFHKKGLAGARMQEIADASGVNKALLHYHFNTKDELFRSVLLAGVVEIFPMLMMTLNSKASLKDKIGNVVNMYVDHLSQQPELPRFVLNELNQNPNFIKDNLQGVANRPMVFVSQVEQAVKAGEIIPVDPFQLMTSIIGLCVFPFVGEPMIRFISGKSEQEFKEFIQNRKEHVVSLLLNGLYCKNNQ